MKLKEILWTIALYFLHIVGGIETSIKKFFRKQRNADSSYKNPGSKST